MDSVVQIKKISPEIVQVTMEDRVNKNTFSTGIIDGLKDCFKEIRNNNNYKVVILTGYDNYFCSGGTKDALLSIQKGTLKFTDVNLVNLLFDCEIPVIAAMQGHGIGAGFTFGLMADFSILSREYFYSTNYMKYGFTPGFGATYILPKKLGFSIAYELLMTGENYRGAELEKRGVPIKVLSQAEVLAYSYKLAELIADKPRESLVILKRHLVGPLKEGMNIIIQQELDMHERTFNNNEEVKERINNFYGK